MKRTITRVLVLGVGPLLAITACSSGSSSSAPASSSSNAASSSSAAAGSAGSSSSSAPAPTAGSSASAGSSSATGSGPAAGASAAGGSAGNCASIAAKYPSVKGRKLVVGSSPGPDNYDAPDPKNPDAIIGVEPDLLTAIGQCAGFTYTMQKQDFSGLIPALQAKHIDAIAAGMYASDERAKQISFVQYMKAGEASVVPKGNPKKLTSMSDTCGTVVGETVGTVENAIWDKQNAACKAAGKPAITFLSYAAGDGAINAVANGRADIFLTDSGVASYLANKNPKFQIGFPIVSDFVVGLGVGKTDTDLLSAMQDSMTMLYDTGKLKDLETKWGFAASQVVKPSIKS